MQLSIVENIEGSSVLWRNEGLLYTSYLSRTVVFHCTFQPMKPHTEKEIIITNTIYRCYMLELVYNNLRYIFTCVQFMTVKVIEGIRPDISRNPTRNISSWKVSTRRHFTLRMGVNNLHCTQYEASFVEQQQ